MKKLIVKTALITVLCVVVVSSLLFGAFAIFRPKIIADISKTLGNYGVAVWGYEKQYKIDNDEDSFSEVNDIYIKYAFNLIDNGEYKKATDLITNFSVNGKTLKEETLNVVLAKMSLKLSNAKESDAVIINNCIEKINNKINAN